MTIMPDCKTCVFDESINFIEQLRAIVHPTAIFVNENRFAFYYEISSGVGGEWSKVGMDEREREKKRKKTKQKSLSRIHDNTFIKIAS